MTDNMAEEPRAPYPSSVDAVASAAATSAMGERVTNMGRRITDIEVEMRAGFSQVGKSIEALTTNLAERNKTQWPVVFLAIGVAFSVLGYFVTQALEPIRDNQSVNSRAIEMLAEKMVTRGELDFRSERGVEDRARADAAIADLRSTTVTRAEWSERNSSRDKENDNIRETETRDMANMQRQIDLLRGDFVSFASSLGNGRDSFTDMKSEIRRLEERLDAWRMRRSDRMPTAP